LTAGSSDHSENNTNGDSIIEDLFAKTFKHGGRSNFNQSDQEDELDEDDDDY
jgi:hypothetical protein